MSVLHNNVVAYELDKAFNKGYVITYPAYLNWIHSHTLEKADFEQTKDFLAYLGLYLFEIWKKKYPDLTLNDLALVVFQEKEEI